jgi:hypothetical protein
LFVILGFVVLALAQLVARIFIIAFPLAGLVAVAHPRGQFAVMQLWSLFTAAFLAAVKFAVVTGLYTLLAAGVMRAPIGGLAKLGALLLLMILGLMFAKPFRSFKTLVPGLDPRHSYTVGALRRITSFAATEVAVTRGVEAGVETTTNARRATQPIVRAEEESLPPLPSVALRGGTFQGHATAGAQTTRAPAADLRRPVWFAADSALPSPSPTVAPTSPTTAGSPPAVVVTPVVLPAPASARNGHAPVQSEAPARQAATAANDPVPVGSAVVRSPIAANGTSLAGLAGPAARGSTAARSAGQVAEPVYARPASHASESMTAPGEMILADKQVDAEGREVFVIYHRGDTYAGAA